MRTLMIAVVLGTACASPVEPGDSVGASQLGLTPPNLDGEYEEDAGVIAYQNWREAERFGGPDSPVGCTRSTPDCRYYRSSNGTVKRAGVGANSTATVVLGAGQGLEYYGCNGKDYSAFWIRVTDLDGVVRMGWTKQTIARSSGEVRCNQLLLSFKNQRPQAVKVWLRPFDGSQLALDRLKLSTPQVGHPTRLRIVAPAGKPGYFTDPAGARLVLRGGNTQGITPDEATDMKALGFNFARYRITFTPGANAKGETLKGEEALFNADSSCLTPENKAIVAQAAALANAGVWTLLEMRGDDTVTTNSSWALDSNGKLKQEDYDWQFYTPVAAMNPPPGGAKDNAAFEAYRCAWRYVVDQLKNTDFIAGYGLLAEPSTNKTHPNKTDPNTTETTLVEFQKAIMDDLVESSGDLVTPFFIGTSWNYDTMNFRHPVFNPSNYVTAKYNHRARLAYEVNYLVPKPWISEGTGLADLVVTYPQKPVTDQELNALIKDSPPDEIDPPVEKTYAASMDTDEGLLKALTKEHIYWYLSGSVSGAARDFALKFATDHSVPMIVDQFGATNVIWKDAGQGSWEGYEADVIQAAETMGFAGWSRWGYNAGSSDRTLAPNTDDPFIEATRGRYAQKFYCTPMLWGCPH